MSDLSDRIVSGGLRADDEPTDWVITVEFTQGASNAQMLAEEIHDLALSRSGNPFVDLRPARPLKESP